MILINNKLLLFVSIFSFSFLYPCIDYDDPLTLAKCAASCSFELAELLVREIEPLRKDCSLGLEKVRALNNGQAFATVNPEFIEKLKKCPNLGQIFKLDAINKETARELVLICFCNRNISILARLMKLHNYYSDQRNNLKIVTLLAPIACLLEPHTALVKKMNDELAGPLDKINESFEEENIFLRHISQYWRAHGNIDPKLFEDIDPKKMARFLSLKMHLAIYHDDDNKLDKIKSAINATLTVYPDKKSRYELVEEFIRLAGPIFSTSLDLPEKLRELIHTSPCSQKTQSQSLDLAKRVAEMSPAIIELLKEEIEFCANKFDSVELTTELYDTLKRCPNFGEILVLDPISPKIAEELVLTCFHSHTLPYLAFILDLPAHGTVRLDSNSFLMTPIAFLLQPHVPLVARINEQLLNTGGV